MFLWVSLNPLYSDTSYAGPSNGDLLLSSSASWRKLSGTFCNFLRKRRYGTRSPCPWERRKHLPSWLRKPASGSSQTMARIRNGTDTWSSSFSIASVNLAAVSRVQSPSPLPPFPAAWDPKDSAENHRGSGSVGPGPSWKSCLPI